MGHRDRRYVPEVYTIKQVADMTGVPENTIRSWERRFGIPKPGRSANNQRAYSTDDVDVIRSIQQSRQAGRTMEQAILDLEHGRPGDSNNSTSANEPNLARPIPETPASGESPVMATLDALLSFDLAAAESTLASISWTTPVETTCFELLLPMSILLHEREATGNVEPFLAEFGWQWIERKLQSAFELARPESGRNPVLVAGMHDDTGHVLGLCHAITTSRSGFRVYWLGGGVTVPAVTQLAVTLSVSVLVLVAGSPISALAGASAARQMSSTRAQGRWQGVIAAAGSMDDDAAIDIRLPASSADATAAIDFEMRRNATAIRLVRDDL